MIVLLQLSDTFDVLHLQQLVTMSEEDPLMDVLERPAQLIALLRRAAEEDSDDIAAAVEDELADAWTWLVQSTKLPPTSQDPKKRQEIQAGE